MAKPLSPEWAQATDKQYFQLLLDFEEENRKRILQSIRGELVKFSLAQGYTLNQTRGAVETLHTTFLSEINAFLYAGTDTLATALTNDTTISWFNLDAGGKTIRERLLDRLA